MLYEREWSNPNYEFLSYETENLNQNTHFHESFEICCILSGEIKITIDNVCYDLKKNDGVIIFPRQLHRYESVGESKMRVVTFLPMLIPEFVNKYKSMLPQNNFLPGLGNLGNNFEPGNIFEKIGLLYSVLGLLVKNTEFKNTAPQGESRMLLKVLKFVECNYTGDCSLQTVSEQLSYGYSYISHHFKRMMNMSYTEYLNRYRINRAVYLLSSGKHMHMYEIAHSCGYDNLCSFNRNFKLITGTSPVNMLKLNEKNEEEL